MFNFVQDDKKSASSSTSAGGAVLAMVSVRPALRTRMAPSVISTSITEPRRAMPSPNNR